jgi:hypothetical protein
LNVRSSLVTAKASARANNEFDSYRYRMTAVTRFLKIKCFNRWLNGRGAYRLVSQLINVLALICLHKSLLHQALALLFMVPQLYCVVARCGSESHSRWGIEAVLQLVAEAVAKAILTPPSNNPDEVLTESSVPYRLVKWLTELKCWGQRLFDRVSPFLYIRKSMPCIGHKLSDQIRQWRKVTFEKCLDARLCKEFSAFCGSSTLLCCPLRPTTFFWLAQFRHSNSACLRSNKIQWYLG